jgi:putative oxidoreductase
LSQTLGKIRDRLHILARRLGPVGPTLARLTVGLVFLKSGWGKLHTLPDVTDYFAKLHIPMPGFNARLAASTEFFGGVLLTVGLGTRLVVLPMAFTMVIAIITAKLPDVQDFWDFVGLEEWTYLVLFLWFALAGAGPLSLDRLVAPRLDRFFGGGGEKKNGPPETVTA